MSISKASAIIILLTLAIGLNAEPLKKEIVTQSMGTLQMNCQKPESWKFHTEVTKKDGREYIKIQLKSSTPQTPPKFKLSFKMPQRGHAHVWSPQKGPRYAMYPDWSSGSHHSSQLAVSMPLYQIFNEGNQNSLTMACDEVFREVYNKISLQEEDCMVTGYWEFFNVAEAPMTNYETTLMLDNRDIFWSEALQEASQWIDKTSGIQEFPAPAEAFAPLYSSWYQFHQNVYDKDIEAECAIASKLGMKTLIVDDGWQTDDTNRGYAFCGDWEVSKNRFPDMAAHVKRVQNMGIKYMMWYSVPYVGVHSKAYKHFEGKYLRTNGTIGVLDPRFPEVREYLASTYEKALREWNLDGFKLDFIDQFTAGSDDPAIKENYAGRDIKTVPDAVNVLMKEIASRLSAIKPGILIEFRQSYIGPAIRQYGNMLRVGDCPGEMQTNRVGIANLRLTSGHSAVHADMLEWNNQESALNASRTIQNCLFGVIQYSVMLRNIPEDHKKVISHWLDFSQKHQDALLHGYFKPYNPEAAYPLIEAGNDNEHIIGVYQNNISISLKANAKNNYIINASLSNKIAAFTEVAGTLTTYDMTGKSISTTKVKKGLQYMDIPSGGYARFSK